MLDSALKDRVYLSHIPLMRKNMMTVLTQFTHATALVTGASSGIGTQYAEYLASQQINLILVARSQDKLDAIAHHLRQTYAVQVTVIVLDLSVSGAALQLYNAIDEQHLSVDILINNAGFGKWAEFLDQPLSVYDDMIMLNMNTLTQLSYLFLPHMLKQHKGIVINIASTGAFQPLPYIAVYGATKAFVLSLTEAIGKEYEDQGVQCIAVCPGNTETQFASVAQANTKGMPVSSTKEVVLSTFKALDRQKMSIIVGMNNYLTALLPRFLSRKMILNIVSNMMKKRIKH